ncbi:MAG: GNAT family N-acetyltransferase [Bacteroidales bacterium]|nr:GNAT family N-acetyltransferase [Bacteroidales bacterium]
MEIKIRKAEKTDIPAILELIKELAEYERAPQEVTITEKQLLNDGFSNNPIFEVILAENSEDVLGMAFYFYSYSTWKGMCLYLEDIIVKNKYRGNGIGEILFKEVIKKAKEKEAKRLQWQVLDWNEPAINFYKKKLNAVLDGEWINCKLTEQQIKEFKL